MDMDLSAASEGLAHGYCLLWDQQLLWLHAVSDGLIALSYFVIPIALVRFIRRRPDVPFNSVFVCFCAFIVLCGATHLLGIWNIWVPDWWLTGTVKAATAIASVATAGLLIYLLPQAIALPSPAQLRAANAQLEAANAALRDEVAQRTAAQAALAAARAEAETMVEVRTAELATANASLRRSEMRYRAAVDATADFIWTVSPAGVPAANSGWAEFTGFSESELAVDRSHFVHPDDRDWVMRRWRHALESTERFDAQHRLRRPDGTWRHVQVTAVPVRDDAGRVVEWIGVHKDVSERIENEQRLRAMSEQLQQAQRLESVGRLAGGIAHDFNNLLTVITGASDALLHDLGPAHPSRVDAEDIVSAANRAAALTAQLLAYSRKQVLQARPVALDHTLAGLRDLLERLIGEQIRVEIMPSPAPAIVLADPNQLEQVILNMAVNARDAMPQGGTLTFEVAPVQMTEPPANEYFDLPPGDYVRLVVRDTGVGMDEGTRSQIFEPFFTTKERGRGTGLGLSMVYGIVRQSGGRIYVESQLGQGTRFTIFLPRSTAAVSDVSSNVVAPTIGGHGTVLVVEDAEDVRLFVVRMLQRAGYTVRAAADGIEAMALLARDASTIDLLLTDVIMPGMNGRELADRVVQDRPDIGVLFMSGYTDNAIVHHGVLDGRTPFIHKPFTTDELLAAVRRVLAERARPAGDARADGAHGA
ncbi:MAG: ATP-binding protein [Gemmatimonadaceae bacterium]|nr:ATP-binding protein [Gemmatimonadaceae bacterium]